MYDYLLVLRCISVRILVGSAISDTQSGGDSQWCQSVGKHPDTMLDDWSS